MFHMRLTIGCLALLTMMSFTNASTQANVQEFGANKAPNIKPQKMDLQMDLPRRGVIAMTSGVTSCCLALVIDIDAKTLTVRRSGDAAENSDSSKKEKVISLNSTELTQLVSAANRLWRSPRRNWGAMCGKMPCMPSLDYASELWLVDGDFHRQESSLNPVDEKSEFSRLNLLVQRLSKPK